MWKQVINGKYGVEEGGWCSKVVRESYGIRLWKAIRKEWELLHNKVDFLVGSGQRVKFWKDKWCGDMALCTSYLALYAIADSKEDWVVDV